jgi:hypothetical protein
MHLPAPALYVWYIQNILEIIFQSVIGKSYYSKAFILFVRNRHKWKRSKLEFETLSKKKNVHITLKDVTDNIISSLKDKQIQKF